MRGVLPLTTRLETDNLPDKPRLVWGEGPKPCDFMLIGEAPGATEDKKGRPFVGAAGKVLDTALSRAGLDRSSVYVTNAYKLRPPSNRDPSEKELETHLNYLRKEFREVQPKYMLLLGKVAKSHVAPILRRRGVWWESPGHIQVMYTWHPAATLYNNDLKGEFFEHVNQFAQGRHEDSE